MSEAPTPFQSFSVIGHNEAKARLESAFDSGKMPHAWLITGPEGVGKTTLAVHAAHMLLSGGENRFSRFNPEHRAARLIAAGSHPDMIVVQRPLDDKTGAQKRTIPVEDARKVAPFLRLTPAFSGARVALIDGAHTLTGNAQNALLKIIEEPSRGAFVFMTATTAAALLPTIRSRCRVLTLGVLTPAQIEAVLLRSGATLPSGAEKEHLLSLSGGSAGFALRLLQTEAFGLFEETMNLVSRLPELDVAALHVLAERIDKKDDAFEIVARLLGEVLRQAVRAAALGLKDDYGIGATLAPHGRLDTLMDLWENVVARLNSAEKANLYKKPVFIEAILALKRSASF